VLESVAAPVTVNLLPTLTSVVNTTGFVDMYIRLYTWCINKFNEDRMQFNYQIISCAVISTMDFILIILTFLKCNTFIQYTRLWICNRTKVSSNKYNFS
jgi:hypothetical protein